MTSCLQHYLENYLSNEVKHVGNFSVASPGQSRNLQYGILSTRWLDMKV